MRARRLPTQTTGLTEPDGVERTQGPRGDGGKDPVPGEGYRPLTTAALIEHSVADLTYPATRGQLLTRVGHRAIPAPGDTYLPIAELLARVPHRAFASPADVGRAIVDAWPTLEGGSRR